MKSPIASADRYQSEELSSLDKARVHREAGHPLMALAHVRWDLERLVGTSEPGPCIFDTMNVTRELTLNHTLEQTRVSCLSYVSLLREEARCQLALGHRLRAMHCMILALDVLMYAVAVDNSLISSLYPQIRDLSDQVLMF